MTVALSARRAVLTPPWVKRPLWKAAREVPSWHIAPALIGDLTDLVAGQSLVTFTNSSPAWGFDSSGVLVQPTANVPFIEYDPATGSALGWRIWDAVTNLVRQSGAISLSTPWSSQGTAPSITTNAIAAPDNSVTATRVTFAAADSRVTQPLNATLVRNTTYTASVFARPVTAGTLNKVRLAVFDGAAQINGSDITLSSGWQRISFTFTTSATTPFTSASVQLRNEFSASIANDVYFWGAQLNIGPLAPYVPTGDLTASSTADVASITGAAFAGIWNAVEDTVYSRFMFPNTPNVTGARVYQITDAAGTDIVWARAQGGINRLYDVTDNNVSQAAFNQGAYTAGVEYRGVLAVKANDFGFAENGGVAQTDTSGTMPTVDRIGIGCEPNNFGSQMYGYIRELAIWKSRRPNANLQSMIQ